MIKPKYLVVFLITFLLGAALAFAYLFVARSVRQVTETPVAPQSPLPVVQPPVALRKPRPATQTPVALKFTKENRGRRCEARRWDSPLDDSLCYKLQEQLAEAVNENDLNGIREALKKGANVNGSYYQAYSPLSAAAMDSKKETVLLLLEKGANVNQLEKWKTSPLQTAVFYRQNEIAEILLENGADVCHKANWDERDLPTPTALDIAYKYGNDGAVELLISFGARSCI